MSSASSNLRFFSSCKVAPVYYSLEKMILLSEHCCFTAESCTKCCLVYNEKVRLDVQRGLADVRIRSELISLCNVI